MKSQDITPANFDSYRETVRLESDRHIYLPGEIVRFRARVLEQDTYHDSWLSRNLRIELLDPAGNPVDQQNIKLLDAKLSGRIQLPLDVKTGWYYLKAYTNWMRNFSTDGFGLLPIKVVNPANFNSDSLLQVQGEFEIRLYPIGNETGVFAGFSDGQGVKLSGWILNEQGDTLAPFSTHNSGWGFMNTNLSAGGSYQVSLEGIKRTNYQNTAKVLLPEGPLMIIEDVEQNLSVSVPMPATSDLRNRKLIVHQSYTVFWASEESLSRYQIPKSILPAGIIQISLLGEDGQIIAKRLWSDYNPESARIENITEEEVYKIRSSYSLDLSQVNSELDYSVMIARDEPGNPLKNFIPGIPGWNCNYSVPNDYQAFKGWLSGNYYHEELFQREYLPETRSGVISGRVIDKNTSQGVSKTGICITILNDNYFDASHTDQNGHFHFAMPGYSGSTDFILNLTSVVDSSLQIEITSPYDPRPIELLKSYSLSEEEEEFIQIQSINLQLKQIYNTFVAPPDNTIKSIETKKTFFHPPDYTVVVNDFIKLANIREVIYEVVPNVVVRKKNGFEYLKVNNDHPFSSIYETLILLDGIPLANHHNLLELPPDRIETIEVKNKIYIHGRSIFSSIVNFVSPNKDYAGLDLPENSVLSTFDLPVPEAPTSINKPGTSLSIPVLENTLLWKSGLKLPNGRMQFHTNDLTGKFQISVYGFDKNGNWVFGKRNFEVGNEN